ncbi:MAG: O-acetyl-ADP-ribose deacetylase [Armatimonadota bacterium]|nr:O-acetyl-ADP-ribose deacetylase [Armatimonadota bacterium]MDR7443707.1 O-acetyl-ADP-ribose deacetylase [Armatimonadota bacterium]MDR7569904.1 O-acetyl-ADP-ribose deacetylase [Armatimonadota bacterium]MDR7613765.1 O-acetyl-ADP-ribose deacetylase [Armatimonadota bacterium]
MEVVVGGTRLELVRGDITQQAVDAIVNAANPTLMGGGGVDGAIHRAGGPVILEECRRIAETLPGRRLPPGEAVITTGGNLPARFVIHTVGPVWQGGGAGEDEILARAYRNSLQLAKERGLRTVAFPSISTGAYGFPVERAARVALRAILGFLEQTPGAFELVRMVLWSERDLRVYEEALREIWPTSSGAGSGSPAGA